MLDHLPVLAVCGWSNSGKTTLIEWAVRRLRERGLDVAVVKHDVHGINVDTPGKDSDRLFHAGADVMLRGGGERLVRLHDRRGVPLEELLRSLAGRYDVVLAEGHKATPLPKVWLEPPDGGDPPAECEAVMATLPWGADHRERRDVFMALFDEWFARQWGRTPLFGCVLPGASGDCNAAVALLADRCERTVVIGRDLQPVPDADGPRAGLLAAMRWAPHVSWLAVSAAGPQPSAGTLDALLAARSPGVWAALSADGPLLPALYDFRARRLLEAAGADPDQLAADPKTVIVTT